MKVPRRELAKVIGERTLHEGDSKKLARSIAAYLILERRTVGFESLLRDVIKYRAEHGIVEATAVSAHPLNEQIFDDVRQILRQEFPDSKEIIIDTREEPGVVGGLRLEMVGEQLDLTVRAKLNKFKRLIAAERN